jgi:tryptophan-rich sensory protein
MRRPTRDSFGLFILCIAIPLLVGWLGSLATRPQIATWYAGLRKPFFTPPSWVFGPVWTALYIMMGVALYLVWRHRLANPRVRPALTAWAIQMLLNAAWSPVFFNLHWLWGALVIIILLALAILLTILLFTQLSRTAAWLMVPYLLWVIYATTLNAAIAWMN